MMSTHDRKAERMVELIEAFRRGERYTAREVAVRFGVHHRTAQRLINSVDQIVPVDRGRERAPVYRLWRAS